ncbi:DUF188 domain-containing protein [Brevibacillus ruminantium]|uniref:UPF0178 protein NDK47_16200 n=1 Tax=Brevibacillus ruminantium TaxID=2950604 RepID=A0ABY4WD79_9BACL|nr:DUF188 domain-containing protein [Brevibacillus ruminantium]USG63715.1 DUF188 domain-containing protein [Brevibacillus ruminantium]
MQEKRVLIDADACPRQVLAIAKRTCAEKGWSCITFASFNHQFTGENHVSVDAGPQAVDMKLANAATAGNIVVTQDIGLAALILAKRAKAVSPHGTIFESERISFFLEERNEKARFRRGGGRTRGPAARSTADDVRFSRALQKLMEESED